MKKYLYILLGIIIGSTITVYAYEFFAKDVEFTPDNVKWEATNVQDALDDLYELNNKEMYSNFVVNTKRSLADTIDLDLKKGTYDCYFLTNTVFNTLDRGTNEVDVDFFVLSGCDNTDSSIKKHYSTVANKATSGSWALAMWTGNYQFTCTVNTDKKITVGINSSDEETAPVTKLVVCK